MASTRNNLVLGRGKVFFERYDITTYTGVGLPQGDGEMYLGNTPSFALNRTETETEVLDSTAGRNSRTDSLVTGEDHTIRFTSDNISADNVAMWEGTTAVISSGGFSIGADTIRVRRGRFNQIGASFSLPQGKRNLRDVVVRKNGTTVPALNNYEVNLETGRIEVFATAVALADGDIINVEFMAQPASGALITSGSTTITGTLRYVSENARGRQTHYFYPCVNISPDGDVAMKGSTWQELPLVAKARKLQGLQFVYIDETTVEQTALPNWTNLTADVDTLFTGLMGYIYRATGPAATAAGMPPLITFDGLVKNNQFPETLLGGYLPDGAATSEGISLMMRGIARAYAATNDPTILTYAKFLMDAACKYFFFNSRPTSDPAITWDHTWIVNGGDPFNVRGPIPPSGDLATTGYVGTPINFVNGIGQLPNAPDVLYQAATDGSVFVWHNVFSEIVAGTGTNVAVEYYIRSDGAKVFGTQKGGSFGQPTEPGSGEPIGRVKLVGTPSGTYLINYAISVIGDQIQYGEAYEGWPMWRRLAPAERTVAADALHWFVDTFRTLHEAEPTNLEWKRAFDRMLDAWVLCCSQESNSLNMFLNNPAGSYNSFPLTYAYAYGIEADGVTAWNDIPPTSRFTVDRGLDGFVHFAMPLNDGLNGRPTRNGVAFECQSLYLNYDRSDAITVDVKVDHPVAIVYSFLNKIREPFQCAYFHSSNYRGPIEIPMISFCRFTGFQWTPDQANFQFGAGTLVSPMMSTMYNGALAMVKRVTLTGDYSGVGVDRQNTFPYAEWTNPPTICYATESNDLLYMVRDADNYMWKVKLPKQATLAPRTFLWSDFEAETFEVPDPPTSPAGGFIKAVQVQNALEDAIIDLAYIATSEPEYADAGDINQMTLTYRDGAALNWRVGDVRLTRGKRRPIRYYGTLPFGYMLGGPSRSRVSTAPYRGPYLAGYQSGTPWTDLQNNLKLGSMLDFMLEAQHQFQIRNPNNILGPFMHCYLPATWDSEQSGELDTWVFDAPDGNPAWNGWQYRAFDAMSSTFYHCAVEKLSMTPKAAIVANRFLDWIYGWMVANPSADYIPSAWGPPGWTQGTPLPADSYLDPHGTAQEPMDIALVWKGATFIAAGGGDLTKCRYVTERCVRALKSMQQDNPSNPMRGSFTKHYTGTVQSYGFQVGEILDAISLAKQHRRILANPG